MVAASIGLVTPVLTRLPRRHAGWEEQAGIVEVAEIARAADRLGYDFLTCSEHVGIPTDVAPIRGSTYWDPLATFGYLAACTERIRFATYVLVLAYNHPLELAKRYGTLDVVCGGRLVLGVGVGSLKEEFDLLGAPFADRGARGDDAIRALRASLAQRQPSYDGPYYRYGDMIVDPCAVQAQMPIWIGGRTARSLRRAVALADGWAPFGLGVAELASMLAGVERPDGFETVLSPEQALDPAGAPDATVAAVGELRAAGATKIALRLVQRSVAHCIEQLEAMSELAVD
jgi:probable F420-dependent oxidoreductase